MDVTHRLTRVAAGLSALALAACAPGEATGAPRLQTGQESGFAGVTYRDLPRTPGRLTGRERASRR